MLGFVLGVGICLIISIGLWFLDRDQAFDLGGGDQVFGADSSSSVVSADDVSVNESEPTRVSQLLPFAGSRLSRFETIAIWFSRPVIGFESLEISANGKKPIALRGQGAGPYEVQFAPDENSSIRLVVGNKKGLMDARGDSVMIPEAWSYHVKTGAIGGAVRLGTIRVQPLAPYEVDLKPSKAWFSVVNGTDDLVDTLGWRLRFSGVGKPDFVVPQRQILPGARSLIEFGGLTDTFGGGGGVVPGRGRVTLLNADNPPREIDGLDYEFSAADSDQSLSWYPDGRFYTIQSQDDPSKEIRAERLPTAPMPSVAPGRYSRPFLLDLLSLDGEGQIWYTIDGSLPTASKASEYSKSIPITKGMVVNACTRRGGFTSPVATYTYVIGDRSTLSEIPTVALSIPGIDPKLGLGVSLNAKGVERSPARFEVWDKDGPSSNGNAFLLPIRSGLEVNRFKGRAFRVQVVDEGADFGVAAKALGFSAGEGDRVATVLPTSLSQRNEAVDWLVDRVSLSGQTGTTDRFVNLVVNGSVQGIWRIQGVDTNEVPSAVPSDRNLLVSGDTADWRRFRESLIKVDLSSSPAFRKIEEGFDLEAFIDYILFGLFWGDRSWPVKSEKVIQDPVTGKWMFQLVDLGEAGFQWRNGTFDSLVKERTISALFFESLLRSARFRRLVSEQLLDRFEAGQFPLLSRLEASRQELERVFGKRLRQELSVFEEERVVERCQSLRRYLVRRGIFVPGKVSTHRLTATEKGARLDFEGAVDSVVLSTGSGDPVQFLEDYWIIGRETKKRVWIPTSDRDFDQWKLPAYDDGDWIEGAGVIGFDKTGLSGETIESRFSELMYNRSSGAYVRVAFDVDKDELTKVDQLVLRCKINDGFVAYLNGKEVSRINVPEALTWNSMAPSNLRGTAWRFREFDLTEFKSQLVSEGNLLAVHGVNSMLNGPSFLVDVELVGRRRFRGEPSKEALVYNGRDLLASDTEFGMRQRVGDTWGPLKQIVVEKPTDSRMVIQEVFFGAEAEASLEFIRLKNVGSDRIDLKNVSLAPLNIEWQGFDRVKPGEIVTIVRSDGLKRFASAWPEREVSGVFTQALDSMTMLELWAGASRLEAISPALFTDVFFSSSRVRRSIHRISDGTWGLGEPFAIQSPPAAPSRMKEIRARVVHEGGGDWGVTINAGASVGNRSLDSIVVATPEHFARYALGESEMLLEHVIPVDGHLMESPFVVLGEQSAEAESVNLLSLGTLPDEGVLLRKNVNGEWTVRSGGAVDGEAVDGVARGGLLLNEVYLPHIDRGRGWIELYNSHPRRPVSLSGLTIEFLNYSWPLSEFSFVASRGHRVVSLPEHLSMSPVLDALKQGGVVHLLSGQDRLDSMVLPRWDTPSMNSLGRLADGDSNQVEWLSDPSPGRRNLFIAKADVARGIVRLSEVMAKNVRSYRGKGDWIELYNPGDKVVSLEGMSLGFGLERMEQWRFPDAARILPQSFMFLRCFNGEAASKVFETRMNTGYSINETGDGIVLFDSDNRVVDRVVFGQQLEDRSIAIQTGNRWAMTKQASVGARNHGEVPLEANPDIELAMRRMNGSFIECRLRNRSPFIVDLAGWNVSLGGARKTKSVYEFPPCSYLGTQGTIAVRLPMREQSHDRLDQLEVRLTNNRKILVTRKGIGQEVHDE